MDQFSPVILNCALTQGVKLQTFHQISSLILIFNDVLVTLPLQNIGRFIGSCYNSHSSADEVQSQTVNSEQHTQLPFIITGLIDKQVLNLIREGRH